MLKTFFDRRKVRTLLFSLVDVATTEVSDTEMDKQKTADARIN